VLTARVSLCLIGRVTRSPTRPDTRPTPTPRPPAFTFL
jgi:hypothetical protein